MSFDRWTLLTTNRNLSRSRGSKDTWRIRRRNAGLGYSATCKRIPAQDEGPRSGDGETKSIIEVVEKVTKSNELYALSQDEVAHREFTWRGHGINMREFSWSCFNF
jgi:hypothetical protein